MSLLSRIPRSSTARRAAGNQLACYSSCPPTLAADEQSRQQDAQSRENRAGRHGRVKKGSPSQRRERDVGGRRFTSATAMHIMRQDKVSFKPVPVHPKQAQMHMALTPSHMPLKFNLGTSHLETDPAVFTLPATQYALKDLLAYPSAVKPDLFFEKGDTVRKENQLRELHMVNGHISKLMSEREGFSDLLNEHQTWSRTFDIPRARSSGNYPEDAANALVSSLLPQPSSSDVQFSNVVSLIEAAQQRLSPSSSASSRSAANSFVPEDPHSALMLHEQAVRAEANKNKPEVDLAVIEVEDLLERLAVTDASIARSMSLGSTSTAFVRPIRSSVAVMNTRQRGLTFGRWSDASRRTQRVRMMVEEEGVVGDFIWMDSVKRKRKKKISKHKYKKRRKATRAERKKLGK